MRTDTVSYTLDIPELRESLSASAFQFLPSEYWDKDILFSTDSVGRKKDETYTSIQYKKYDGTKPFFSIERVDGVFALLLLCFLFLTHVYKGGVIFFKENLPLIFTTRQKINQLSETTVSEFWYNFVLTAQFIILSAIVFFIHFLDSEASHVPANSFLMVLLFCLVITLFLVIKIGLYKLVGFIFDIQAHIKIWIRSYTILIEIVGMIAFIPVLLLVYSDYFHDILTIFFLSLFLLSRLIIIYRIAVFFLQENVNFLFLIAYLCSAEIIPYILLYEGLAYLFKIDVLNSLWL